MLKEFFYTILSYSGLLTIAERTDKIVSGALAEQPFIVMLSDDIKSKIKNLTASMGKNRTSQFTQLLAEMDDKRDAAFLAFRDFIKACINRKDEKVSAAAETLFKIIKKQGQTLYNFGYTDESAALNLLFRDLEKPEAAAAIKAIGAESWYEEVKTSQAAFEETYKEKVSSEAQQEYANLKDAFTKLGRRLNLLMETIAFFQDTGAIQNIDMVVEQLNEVITDAMATARARRTRQSGEDEEVPAETEVVEEGV